MSMNDTEEQLDTMHFGVEDSVQQLLSSLYAFYVQERAFIGSISGKRSEERRAKTIARATIPSREKIVMLRSLARSLEQAASILEREHPEYE